MTRRPDRAIPVLDPAVYRYAALAFDDFKAVLNLWCARKPRTSWRWNYGSWWCLLVTSAL